MTKNQSNSYSIINIYKKPSTKSEVVTQMLYGESFSIFKKANRWLKVKIKEDGYKGYVQNKNFSKFLKPSYKISVLKAKIYKLPNKRKKVNIIPYGSKIKVLEKKNNFLKFSKGWIHKNDIKPISYVEKNPFKKISIFKSIKYKWGGKSFKGIDCSALIQTFFIYNNSFYPRDTKDQIKYSKKNFKRVKFKKGDIIFWKGHVAICLNSKQLIHAYGPEKKVIIMPIIETINRIKKTASLKVKKITRINY